MSSGYLTPFPIFQAFGTNGQFLAGGLLYTYAAGTTTPIAVYQDPALLQPWTNPIVLNAFGQATIWLTPGQSYKFNLTDSSGNTLPGYPVDQISIPGAGTLSQILVGQALYPQTAAEFAVSLVPTNYYYPPGNVLRYGTNAIPGTTDMTAAIQAALNQAGETGLGGAADAYLPPGTYLVSTQLTIGSDTRFYGSGASNSVINYSTTQNADNIVASNANNVIIERITHNVLNLMTTNSQYVGVIAFRSCNNCRATDNEIIGASFAGVYLQGSYYCEIVGNYFHNFSAAGYDSSDIHLQQTATQSCAYNIITRNECFGGSANGIALETSGTAFQSMWKNTIANNHVGAHTGYGILLYSHSGNDTYNEVIGNYVENISGSLLTGTTYPKGAGIYVAGMSAVTVANNRIYNCCSFTNDGSLAPGGIGFDLPATGSLCTIIGNSVFDMAQGNTNGITIAGIYINPGSLSISSVPVNITGNSINQSIPGGLSVGILLSAVSNSSISGNAVNILNTIATTRGIFSYANGASNQNITISGNVVSGCSYRGITLEQNGGFLNQVFSVTGNSISGGASTSVPLSIANSSQGSVTGNSLNASSGAALNISGAYQVTYAANNIVSTGVTAVVIGGLCSSSTFSESNNVFASTGFGSSAINNSGTGVNVRQMVNTTPQSGAGTAQLGDVGYSNAGAGTSFAWWCTTAGTPGTWTALTIP